MEPLLKINDDKCIVCYACVRACPVKAIRVRSEYAKPEILPGRCIGCGNCLAACSPDAIEMRDSKERVKTILKESNRVAALVDPSIAGEFPDITDYRKFVSMVRELGFHIVQEVSFGADLVARKYKELVQSARGKYYLFSNCPVTVMYIEKYKPELIPNLAPVLAPGLTTGKIVRALHGENTQLVYISPLIASKEEIRRLPGEKIIDEVITFRELRDLFDEKKLDEKKLEYSDFDDPMGYKGSLFPLSSGIMEAADLDEKIMSSRVVTSEGEQILRAIDEFEENITRIKSHFNLFFKEFIMGRGTSPGGKKYLRRSQLIKYVSKRTKSLNIKQWVKSLEELSDLSLERTFMNDNQRLEIPSEKKVDTILDELDQSGSNDKGCGACGYSSCKDFAIAIAQGLAIPEMCNTYATRNRMDHIKSMKITNEKLAQAQAALKESEKKAKKEKESASEASEIMRAMLQKLPSGLVILDEKLKIIQANQTFIDLLGTDAKEINEVVPGLKGADMKTLLPYNFYNLFTYVLANNENITNRDINYAERLLSVSVFVIRKNKIVGAIIRDLSDPEVQKEEIVKRLGEVVDKNLNLVQQIGFILGEGAAETERMLNSIIESYQTRKGK